MLFILLISFTYAFNLSFHVAWNNFKQKYSHYKTVAEEKYRKKVFLNNYAKLTTIQSNQPQTLFTINQFSDKTEEELQSNGLLPTKSKMLTSLSFNQNSSIFYTNYPQQPNYLSYCGDYVKNNDYDKTDYCVETTMNQGSCGSCYAMVLSQYIQILYYKLSGIKEIFSTQQIIDCSTNRRCCGGWPPTVLSSLRYFVREKDYPYTDFSKRALCTSEECHTGNITPIFSKDYLEISKANDKETIKQILLYYGPFIAMMHSNSELRSYHKGILHLHCQKGVEMNHAVLVVGYGEEDGEEFVIIRNSWGNWGENGYARISFDDMCGLGGSDGNVCGAVVIFPELSSSIHAEYNSTAKMKTQPNNQH
ncbi:Cysteine protease [Entamoeba marina]